MWGVRSLLQSGRRTSSIRMRLTVMYGALFLVTGVTLLTIGYLLARHSIFHGGLMRQQQAEWRQDLDQLLSNDADHHVRAFINSQAKKLYDKAANRSLHQLAIDYVGILVLMFAASVAAGWLLAGRALAPLRSITTTARRVSGENLGERIALVGPDDELKELADTFDGMLERLDASFASQRHFVANASHELRTPLAIMRTEIDVALADPDASAEDLRLMAEEVLETVDRSEALIASLLTLARSEAAPIRFETVDLAELVETALDGVEQTARERGVTIVDHSEPLTIAGDAVLLERVTVNLLQNAVLHNKRGGQVSISTGSEQKMARLTVENDGAKLDPEAIAGLTRPFRRLDRSVPGFGVGLSIAETIVKAHSGRLELAGRESGGLRVDVLLPVRERAAATPRPLSQNS